MTPRCAPAAIAEVWERVVGAFPAVAPWIDAEPVTGIDRIAGIADRSRRLVLDRQPIVTGLVAVGDASTCTSPALGRGASMAALHVSCLRDVLASVGSDLPVELMHAFDAATAAVVTPLIDDTLRIERHRLAQVDAQMAGADYTTDDPVMGVRIGPAVEGDGRSRGVARGDEHRVIARPRHRGGRALRHRRTAPRPRPGAGVGTDARRAGVVGRCRPVAGARTGAALSVVDRAVAERGQRARTSYAQRRSPLTMWLTRVTVASGRTVRMKSISLVHAWPYRPATAAMAQLCSTTR